MHGDIYRHQRIINYKHLSLKVIDTFDSVGTFSRSLL